MPTVARAVNKPPLTPKVATRTATAPHQNPPATTPLARRVGPRPELVLAGNGAVSREKEEVLSPVPGFLGSNITPRSGPRQVRVDSASSTPTGTPNPERHDSWETRSGLGPGVSIDEAPRRPMVSFSSPLDMRQDADSKFFYASDAPKSTHQTAHAKSPTQLQKPATFFYANGETIPTRENAPHMPFTPMLATPTPPPQQEAPASKFVYANGAPDLPPVKLGSPLSPGPSASVPTSSRIPTSRPMSQGAYAPRPASPAKVPSHTTTSRPTSTSGLPSVSSAQRSARTTKGHARSGSLSSNLTIAEPPAVARILSVHNSLPSSEASSPATLAPPPLHPAPANPAMAGFASLLQAAEDFAEEDETRPESLNSPAKSPSQEKQLNDLVVSARRERKVQDLQITNASLEAINRTLERQLRKQTAEIRRYRRLSRSGRLSLTAVNRIPSDSTVDGGALARAGMNLDDLSEEESELEEMEEEEEEEEEEDISDSEESGELDPSALKLRDARHRQKDERRLHLDLSKHQQLLVDSQKINQSLKRCLGWTEELIKEGKRALEYTVRVSEVELGGRVLAPEDIEAREAREAREALEMVDSRDGDDELDEDITLQVTNPVLAARFTTDTQQSWSKDAQDRDSGIELPADGG
ncbi:hypothetical protein OQA88_1365 [Cercophora sp. LCS_1]